VSLRIVRRPQATFGLSGRLHPVLQRVYSARGVRSEAELDQSLVRLLPVGTLEGIPAAAELLCTHRLGRVLVVGDFDADGATSCALVVRALRGCGFAHVDFLVPNRFEFGYGLTPEIVALAAQMQPRLLVTVDNGIASVDGVDAATELGIDVLITDHHLPGAVLPAPAIIVNPNQPGCAFPSKHVAGVGVMFYVLLATRALLRNQGAFNGRDEPNLAGLVDLVALGTVADVVRLDQVNRIFVEQGLARIRAGRAQPGVLALFAVAGRDAQRATAFDLGFVAGPRLNAAGRLADMSLGIRCLLARTQEEAMALAGELDRLNRQRRDVEASMQEEALADMAEVSDATSDQYSVCLYREEWHQGVVGIVASRLKDRFHRPAIVFARGTPGELKGSGRSIAGFHLRDAIDLVAKREPALISRFGGHAFAAGLTIAEAGLPAFAAAFEQVAREQLTPAQLHRTHESDGVLDRGELTLELAAQLRDRVWGQGMPAPAFDDTFDVMDSRVVGVKHLRLSLGRGDERFDAILFNRTEPLPARIRAAYRLEVNEWQGRLSLQLNVEHWLPA
jgi:single-stranded-DNA-specific exonuclease